MERNPGGRHGVEPGMTPDTKALLLTAATLVLLGVRRWRPDAAALLSLLAAVALGVVPAAHALDGFADPAVAAIGLLAVAGAAVRGSGVFERVTDPLRPLLRWTTSRILVLGGTAALASAFVSHAAVLQAVLPVAQRASRRSRQPAAPAVLAVALAALLGGLATAVGTVPNLLVSGARQRLLGQGYGLSDFAFAGVPVAALGLAALCAAWRILPRRGGGDGAAAPPVEGFTSEVLVPPDSPVVGRTLAELRAGVDGRVQVQAVIREGLRRIPPRAGWPIEPGDVLVLACEPDTLQRLMERAGLLLAAGAVPGGAPGGGTGLDAGGTAVIEAVVTPASRLIGQSAGGSGMEARRISLLGIGRSGGQPAVRLRRVKLRAGDVLVLQGERATLPGALQALGCLPLQERQLRLGRRRQVLAPLAVLAAALAAPAYGVLPLPLALLGAALALVALRAVSPEEAYAAVPWPVLVTVAALLPLSAALSGSGAADLAASALAGAGLPHAALLAVVLAAGLLLAPLVTGAAAVLTLAPVAAALAVQAGAGPDAFLMAAALGASCEGVALLGRDAVRALMQEAGIRRSDRVRMGAVMALVVLAGGVPALLLAWPR